MSPRWLLPDVALPKTHADRRRQRNGASQSAPQNPGRRTIGLAVIEPQLGAPQSNYQACQNHEKTQWEHPPRLPMHGDDERVRTFRNARGALALLDASRVC